MVFVNVASKEDLSSGKMMAIEIKGESILLVNLHGEYYAIGNKCTHRRCKLSKGTLNEEIVKCPCHRSRFNIKTGEVIGGPATKPQPKYEIKLKENQIQIAT